MIVKKIVANIATLDVSGTAAFYRDLLGLDIAMDMGWITTLTTNSTACVQLSIMNEGGGGTPVPDLSIEVEDVDAVYARAVELGYPIDAPLRDEPWGVRRFFIVDPAGKRLNILAHLT